MANTFLAVEGPQDSEFIARLLKRIGFEKIRLLNDLDQSFCRRLLNTDYPIGGDLYARMLTPMYMRRGEDWVAIRSAGGANPQLLTAIATALQSLRPVPTAINSIGVIRDADDRSADDCFSTFLADFKPVLEIEGFDVQLPNSPGEIANGSPRFGTYIFPDNDGKGALETLLQDCGNSVYPDLMRGAETFVNSVEVAGLSSKDAKLFKKPFGPQKATVACVADILKPGMSIQTSIDQNGWIGEQTITLPRIASLTAFLADLVGEVV